MARDDEDFLRRWSRRKLDAANAPPLAPEATAVPLPSPDSLTFESDFKAFMQAKVEESVKRAALKKLFSDPRFNVMDGLDIYIDDYSKDVPLPQEMLERLAHARATLLGPEPEKPAAPAADEKPSLAQAEAPPKKEDDGAAG
jgi:hypothetical protein